jgi:hypothetical protein
MIEPLTEKVKVRLINGTEAEVLIKKYIPFRKKQQIYQKAMDGIKINSKKNDEIDFDASRGMNIISELVEEVWADKNISLDEVEGDSLYKIINERFSTFLGNLGLSAKN